ncbi:MAG: ankyrin repeat domain-containing protein [Deferribacteraceae bacterium]|jgi:serine/threonine-protein phosphatase 6 regulatory ankyrin repeat subunit B|nr:ankyrin repeat domain-containing protein [Deferribacteraceae bacterium]
MKKLLLIVFLLLPVAIYAQTASYSILEDGKKARIYNINDVTTSMPAYMRIPLDTISITVNTSRKGQGSISMRLNNTTNGWMMGDYLFATPGQTVGVAFDFSTGRGYALPKELAAQIIKTLTYAERLNLFGVTANADNQSDMQIVFVDSAALRREQVDKYLMIIDPKGAKGKPLVQTPTAPKYIDNRTANPNGVIIKDRPLVTAAANGQTDLVKKLLASGVSINESDPESGDNAIMKALKASDEPMAANLLRLGIDARHTNRFGQNALHIAGEMGFYDSAQRLLSAGTNLHQRDNNGNTVLMYAATSPNPYLVDLLLKRGARVNELNNNKDSALSFAAYNGNTKSVENLLANSANPNNANSSGSTVLMEAVRGGNEEITKDLLKQDLNVNVKDGSGNTALHLAAAAGYTDIAKMLIAAGADVNINNNAGKTPLMLAVANKNSVLTGAILEKYPDLNAADNLGQTVYDISSSDAATRQLIANETRNINSLTMDLFGAIAAGDGKKVEQTLDAGAKINYADPETGNTPIFVAVANSYNDILDTLIDRGADVNWQNKRGNTPLMLAASTGNERTVEQLAAAGADMNVQNENGDTALIWATNVGRMDVIRTLLVAKANPNIRNYDSVSALSIAVNKGMADEERMLRSFGAF